MVVGRDGARCRCGRPSGLQAGASPRAARDPEAGGAFPACRYPGLVRAGDEEPGRAPPTPRLPAEPQAPSGPHARRVGRPQETKPVEPIEEKPKVKTKFQKRSEKLYAVLKPPYFILTVIIIIVSMYLWGSERARMRLEWSPGAWWREPWRLLSYGAIHASATHLATNAIVALAVGWVLEREQGRSRVCAIWAAGLAAGALGAGALQPRVRVVGASAAVYALLTAHLPNVCLRFGHIPLWWFRPLSVVVLATSETLSWVLLRTPADAWAVAPVAWSAHALGAAVGIPVGFLVFTGENSNKTPILIARLISALVLIGGTTLATIHYVFWHELET
ncbi:rhomboid-related protein 2-like isoform X1 [Leguminivora glycinivorella]|uniref:rhomboid-related protein 2-like isoform X1 n=1 Tax=Leguminivora glycinivorella TaxID=1035111 RepID=UPI00200F5CB3|nr:rhomboid-related protein 2-like isoform X1 [Leguminivora glycinivorella]XP_047988789.1 rhomboid-related protein 2-like isoform X1 [Leguminivora glycinivorella]